MAKAEAKRIAIDVDAERRVSGLVFMPKGARAVYVLAHGAGAGMTHPFMEAVARDLAERGVGTLRYQFPYMERGSRRPDSPRIAQAAVRAAIGETRRLAPRLPMFAGGKSFGGRMTSQAEAEAPLAGISGIAFLGFPLHPPGNPSDGRGDHLADVDVPMLFLQGTRDEFADLALLKPLVKRLGAGATLCLFDEANHSFHVPARTGRKDADVRGDLADALVAWTDAVIAR